MIRPDLIGAKCFYLNQENEVFTTAQFAAIDSLVQMSPSQVLPFAHSATVREDYDAQQVLMDDAGTDLAADRRMSFGIFLSPDNDKGNLLFQVMGRLSLFTNGTANALRISWFFGRKATDNTVTTSKSTAGNTLANYFILPSKSISMPINSTTLRYYEDSIETEVFSLKLAGGFVYCFGVMIDNLNAASGVTLKGAISLAMRKYGQELDVYRPSR